jgi:hypothetical protein
VAARVDRGVTELLDVAATIRAIAGVAPGRWGASLVDRIVAPAAPSIDRAVVFANLGYVGVRTEALTMTWDAKTGEALEVYDRAIDPQQRDNRVGDPRHAEALRAGWAEVVRERT